MKFSLPNRFSTDVQAQRNFTALEQWVNGGEGLYAFVQKTPVLPDKLPVIPVDKLPDIPVDKLPDWPGYFEGYDPPGAPAAPANFAGAVAFKNVILSWDIPPEALWRKWEVYEGTTSNFVPDTTAFTNRIAIVDACVTTVVHEPGPTTYYYKVCAVNTRGERSSFVSAGPFVFQPLYTIDMNAADLAAIKAEVLGNSNAAANAAIAAAGVIVTADIAAARAAAYTDADAAAVAHVSAAVAQANSDIATARAGAYSDADAAAASRVSGAVAQAAIDIAAAKAQAIAGGIAGSNASGVAYLGTVAADKIVVGTATIIDACIGNIVADKIVTGTLGAEVIYGGTVNANKIVAAGATIADACIGNIVANKIVTGTLGAEVAYIGTLAANRITGDAGTFNSALIGNLDAGHIQTGTLGGDVAYIGTIGTDKIVAGTARIGEALIADLSASKITSGELAADRLTAADGIIARLNAGTAQISQARIANLDAGRINVGELTGFLLTGSIFRTSADYTVPRVVIDSVNYPNSVRFHCGLTGQTVPGMVRSGSENDYGMTVLSSPCIENRATSQLYLKGAGASANAVAAFNSDVEVGGKFITSGTASATKGLFFKDENGVECRIWYEGSSFYGKHGTDASVVLG